jgi:hypothetical protein
MRASILEVALGLVFVASAQAAPVSRNTAGIELAAAPHIELVRDGCGRGWHQDRWRDQSGDWHWGHCIPVPATPGPKVGAIPTQIGTRNRLGDVGVTNRSERRVLFRSPTILSRESAEQFVR